MTQIYAAVFPDGSCPFASTDRGAVGNYVAMATVDGYPLPRLETFVPAERANRIESVTRGLLYEMARTVSEAERAPGGMRVPFHGEFTQALGMPSVVNRFRWWVREMCEALGWTPEQLQRFVETGEPDSKGASDG